MRKLTISNWSNKIKFQAENTKSRGEEERE